MAQCYTLPPRSLLLRSPKPEASVNIPHSKIAATSSNRLIDKLFSCYEGFLASAFNLTPDSANLKQLEADLTQSRQLLGGDSGLINVGASFITGHESITKFAETTIPLLKKNTPAVVWLFAPDGEVKPHSTIIQALKGLEHPPKVFVQVGNVTAAKEAVQDGADVLVCQGIDAGGHQFRRGMGVVSFIPEVKKMLTESFGDRDIPVFAAGGIVNGQGVAAAQALGMFQQGSLLKQWDDTNYFLRRGCHRHGYKGMLLGTSPYILCTSANI